MTTVMVVDDHFLVRAALVALLEASDDLTVAAVAANGFEAVELARSVRPEVVLMDLSMPHLDGVEATRRILSERPQTRIIVLTSAQGRYCIDAVLELGAVAYLQKGCAFTVVLDAVRRAAATVPV